LERLPSNDDVKGAEQLEKEWLRQVHNAKPGEEAAVIRPYLEKMLADSTSPFGQLLHNFVRAKFREKADLHKKLDTQRMQQLNAPQSLVDVAPSNLSAAASASTSVSGNETAQAFTEDFVGTIVRRYRLRPTPARLVAIAAAVETTMYAQVQGLYATAFADRDAALATKLKRLLTLSPAHIGVPQRFWLAAPTDTAPPFADAIAVLRQLDARPTPASKLRALVDTCGAIVAAVAQRARDQVRAVRVRRMTLAQRWAAGEEVLTADLLLPLLTYVVIRSGHTRLYSLTRFLEDFISETEEIHEVGYSLVTFQTALTIIERLDEKDFENGVSFDQVRVRVPPLSTLIACTFVRR
jgi:hypothetical protein